MVAAPFAPEFAKVGRSRAWPVCLVFDGIQYVLRFGCAWAPLVHGTALRWLLRLPCSGAFEDMMRMLALDRALAERGPLLTAAVMDARTVRPGTVSVAGVHGYDSARCAVGRKRHVLVDTDGRLLDTCVSAAPLHDSHGGIRH